MSPDRRHALLAVWLAALAAGCAPAAPDRAPHLERLEPAGGTSGAATTVLVRGRGFHARAVQSAAGGPQRLDTTQKAWLDGVALDGVTWVDEETLRLTVPAGLALGPHELTVENALGLRTTLRGAWTVIQPAALSVSSSLSAAVASTGQALALTVTLRNDGGTTVQGVAVALETSGGGQVVAGAPPAPVDVPAGGSVDVQVPLTAQGAGTVSLKVSAAGSEVFTGRALRANAEAAVLTVMARAALTAALALPAAVSVVSPFTVTLTVQNDGDATALGVSPGPLALAAGAGGLLPTLTGPSPAQADIPGHGSATFTWSAQLTSGATVVLSGGAAGTDLNDGKAVTAATATSNPAVPQAAAALAMTAVLSRSVASTTQRVDLQVVVRNDGAATAQGVSLAVAAPGTGAVTAGPLPAAFDLAPGASASYTLALTAASAGSVAVNASASGAEITTGLPLSAAASAGTLRVQARAALTATLSLPATVTVASAFTVTMTVANGGDAAALGVSPGPLGLAAGAGGLLPTLSGPTPAQADVPGHGSATFTWTAQLTSGGTVVLSGGAAGTDANDGKAVTAAPASSNTGVPQASAALSLTATLLQSVTSSTRVSVASTTQVLGLRLVVRNTGGATARNVALAVTAAGSGAATVGTLPAAFDLAPGASATQVIALTATSAGSLAVNASALATEITTGLPLSAAASAGGLTVEARAALSATLALPATVTAATSFTVTMTVSNGGDATARAVSPGPLGLAAGAGGPLPTLTGPSPAQKDIPGHGSATFTWTAQLTSGATVVLTGGAEGTDGNDGAPVTAAAATSNAAVPQVSAALSLTATIVRSVASSTPVSVGSTTQVLGLRLVVTNTGGATARNVTLAATASGSGAATVGTLPAAFDLAAGASSTQVIALTATSAGSLAVSASASGAEISTAFPLSATASAGTLTVQVHSALTATLAIPTTIALGSNFTATMTVSNSGDADALGVVPATLLQTVPLVFLLVAGPVPASATVPGHGSATFTWTMKLQLSGPARLICGAAGTDANDRLSVVAPTVQSNDGGSRPEAWLAVSDPFGDGSAIGQLAVHGGLLWLGPSADGRTFWRLDPATGQTAIMGTQVSVDQGSSPAGNTAWRPSQTASTFGFAGCASNTTNCGPSNEAGRGLLVGGAVFGTDWLIYGGAGGSKEENIYLASGLNPAFQTVDLVNALPPTTDGLTAAAFVDDGFGGGTLYLGITDKTGANSPYLVALTAWPTLNWLDPTTAQAVELGTAKMTGLGGGATFFANSEPQPRLDAIFSFRGLLYVAGNGGIWRSTVGTPRSYASFAGDWTQATPVLNWTAKNSIGVSSSVDLTPAKRAVPAMAAFGTCGSGATAGPCLFLARNVIGSSPSVVPQLWFCDPTSAGPASACDASDWTHVVPNTSGDGNLTQLNVATRGAVSVLLATSKYLYLGFDDATTGVQLFRTSVVPTRISDFKGSGGCSAGTAGCVGLGGGGFGDATRTRFLGAQAITIAGSTTVYATVAGASGAMRLIAVGE